jgi:hypothetical protein
MNRHQLFCEKKPLELRRNVNVFALALKTIQIQNMLAKTLEAVKWCRWQRRWTL